MIPLSSYIKQQKNYFPQIPMSYFMFFLVFKFSLVIYKLNFANSLHEKRFGHYSQIMVCERSVRALEVLMPVSPASTKEISYSKLIGIFKIDFNRKIQYGWLTFM